MTGGALDYQVLPEAEAVAQAGAAIVRELAGEAIAARGRFAIALAGGSTPRRLYELLATADPIDWSKVEVFFGDERCVLPRNAASNYRMAHEALLSRIALPASKVHRIQGELGPLKGSWAYGADLAAFFGTSRPPVPSPEGASDGGTSTAATFDLVLLGMGPDGHTASLFPGDAALASRDWASAARAPAGMPVADRVTLTLPAIASAERVLFLVAGEEKAGMVGRVLRERDGSLPAARVGARAGVTWLLDRAAAGALEA